MRACGASLKIIGLPLGHLEFLYSVFFLFLEKFGDRVTVRDAAADFLICVLCIVSGAVILGGVLGVHNPRSLAKG